MLKSKTSKCFIMKKPVVFLGLIILFLGLFLLSYRMQIEIRLPSPPSPDVTWKWIPKEKVDEYQKLGWREYTGRYVLPRMGDEC